VNTAIKYYSFDATEGENSNYNIPEKISMGMDSEDSRSLTINSIHSETFNDNVSNVPTLKIAPGTTVSLKGKFTLLQLWEGRIVEVREDDKKIVFVLVRPEELPRNVLPGRKVL